MPDFNILNWLTSDLLGTATLLQLGLFVLILIVARPTPWLLKRLAAKLPQELIDWPTKHRLRWLDAVINILKGVTYPLAIVLLSNFISGTLERRKQPDDLLLWLTVFITLWLMQRLLNAIVEIRMKPEHARTWKNQIIRPFIVLIAVLHAFGLLDGLLSFGVSPSPEVIITLRSLLISCLIVTGFVLLSRNSRTFLREVFLPRAGVDAALTQVISTGVAYFILGAGIFVGFTTAGINLTNLTIIISGLSVGIGFGLQHLVNNFISGVILLTERSLVPGDVVQIEETSGVVEDIRLRTTLIRTDDNSQHLVPNGTVLANVVVNYTRDTESIRVCIPVGVSYHSSPDVVIEALLESAQHPQALAEPTPQVILRQFDDNRASFELRVWVSQVQAVERVSSDIRLQIWNTFQARQIPGAHRDLIWTGGYGSSETLEIITGVQKALSNP